MKHVMLGAREVSRIGLSVMTASHGFTGKSTDDAEAVRAVHRALGLGVTFIDTAEVYGFLNEKLVGQALEGWRDHVVVATKFVFVSHTGHEGVFDSTLANVRAALEGSGKRRGIDHIDLLYQHRVDPDMPIEETVGAMAELTASCIAHRWARDSSPASSERWTQSPDGMRLTMPCFCEPAGMQSNLRLADEVKVVADEAGVAPAQAVLAWLMAQGEDIESIPGTRHVASAEESTSADVQLTPDRLARLSRLPAAMGDRLSPDQMAIFD
jgi:aryl-alcohol dehydrogenase-like predicted oxidoreductase